MNKKKILFIIPVLPYPIVSGGHHALFGGITAVANDYEVYLAYEALDNEGYHKSLDVFMQLFPHIHHLPLVHPIITKRKSWLQTISYRIKVLIWNYLHHKKTDVSPDPAIELIHSWKRAIEPQSSLWQKHIIKVCNQYKFDIIQVEMPWLLSTVFNLPKEVKKVFVHHELGFVKRELEIKGFGDSVLLDTYKRYVDLNEISQLNLYDSIITLSHIDSDKLRKVGITKPIFTSFAPMECSDISVDSECDGFHLVFVGPDSNQPNLIGLTWFLDNCWERLLCINNAFNLKIIGKWSVDHINYFNNNYSNVSFIGYVDDLEKEMKGSIMIVPITIGSGIRIKILEACSKGIPFVSTSVGAEGIPVKDGVHCIIADDPDSFIKGILTIQDRTVQKRFIAQAAKMIEENYSYGALRKNRIEIYESLLDLK